jgi:hypothetical protein
LGINHPNNNTSKVQDTRFNKQDLLKGIKRIGGGGDGGLDIVPHYYIKATWIVSSFLCLPRN